MMPIVYTYEVYDTVNKNNTVKTKKAIEDALLKLYNKCDGGDYCLKMIGFEDEPGNNRFKVEWEIKDEYKVVFNKKTMSLEIEVDDSEEDIYR